MIHLERVNGDTIWDILKLTVADHQKNFVAGNDVSIIEAYIAITSNGYAFPFGIFEDDTPVGFVMIGYDKDEYWKVELALRFIRTFPCGKADFCWLSYEPENTVAKSLYASFGFVETGDKDGEEQIAVLKL